MSHGWCETCYRGDHKHAEWCAEWCGLPQEAIDSGDTGQLDRIEKKLDRILELLEPEESGE